MNDPHTLPSDEESYQSGSDSDDEHDDDSKGSDGGEGDSDSDGDDGDGNIDTIREKPIHRNLAIVRVKKLR